MYLQKRIIQDLSGFPSLLIYPNGINKKESLFLLVFVLGWEWNSLSILEREGHYIVY